MLYLLRCCEAITFNLIIHNKGRWAFVHLLFLEIIIILFVWIVIFTIFVACIKNSR
nr:MAG TPA: hypothetical protein [Caudoviricetes sp.]DAR28720.1 MAG TPA: hypothetical protein [Herelleviridae sp.]DAS90502.1 MAG TPA: hypothetical protein [Herelleviridae sp.]